MFTFVNVTLSPKAAANSSYTGIMRTQYPHHGAQKSTTVTLSFVATTSLKFADVTSIIALI